MNPTDQPNEQHDDREQTGRTYSSGEITRRIRNRRQPRLEPTPAYRALADQLITEVIKHERDNAARRAAAGDTNPYDLDPLEDVRNIADDYTRHADRPDALDDLLDLLADELSLDDLRALRIAGEAAVAATPRAIMAAADSGTKPPQIASEIGLTQSRVYQVLREERQKRATALVEFAVKQDAAAGGDPRDALSKYSAALDAVPEEHREAAEQYLETLRLAVAKQQTKQPDDQ